MECLSSFVSFYYKPNTTLFALLLILFFVAFEMVHLINHVISVLVVVMLPDPFRGIGTREEVSHLQKVYLPKSSSLLP